MRRLPYGNFFRPYKPVDFRARFPLRSEAFANVFLVGFIALLLFGFTSFIVECNSALSDISRQDLSFWNLPKCTFFSLCRGLIAYFLSLCFSIAIGYVAAKDRLLEKIIIPILDILQSIPVLGFMPGFFLLFVSLFPGTTFGLELTCILMIFTSQVWNMTFSVYHSLRTIPAERSECATLYGFTRLQTLTKLELPSCALSLLWNSIMSMAGGWFFLMASEAFTLRGKSFSLPGLGSYMSASAAEGNIGAMAGAIFFMILLIVFIDQFLWSPLVAHSQKFSDATGSETPSRFLELLKSSSFSLSFLKKISLPFFRGKKLPFTLIIRLLFASIFLLGIFALIEPARILAKIPRATWLYLARASFMTFGRVLLCLSIGVLAALPLGLVIGLSKKKSGLPATILQIGASFPATLLFPAIIYAFRYIGIPFEILTVALMLTGTVWYILFTVIAGTRAIPQDLQDVCTFFSLSGKQKLFSHYIPAVFPYLVTGMISGAGGAWNASIVAEYISYQGKAFSVEGIGSSIALSAQQGEVGLLLASIAVMSLLVAVINYFVWLRLYRYSEKRFSLNN